MNNNSKIIIDYGRQTHPGGRDENQDYLNESIDREAERFCFVLTDGLGGHRGGRIASEIAVETILDYFPEITENNIHNKLSNVMTDAHNFIRERGKTDYLIKDLQTTCVVLIVLGKKAFWSSIGDSRIYIFRKGDILFKSRDHSVVQLLMDLGEIKPEEVRGHPDRNRVLKTLGMDDDPEPSVFSDGLDLEQGDIFLLCTDGFWEYISDEELIHIFKKSSIMAAQQLIDSIFENIILSAKKYKKKHDNLTAQLIMVK